MKVQTNIKAGAEQRNPGSSSDVSNGSASALPGGIMKEGPGYTLFDFLVYIFEQRKFAQFIMLFIAVPVLATLGVGLILWSIMRPTVESVGPQGTLRLKMGAFMPEVYTILVHPHGWQNTGVLVSPNDVLRVKVSGKTNVGLDVVTIMENARKARAYMDQVRNHQTNNSGKKGMTEEKAREAVTVKYESTYRYGWPWVDAKGYPPELPVYLNKIPTTFAADKTLLSPKYPAGRLIGYIGDTPDDQNQQRIIDFAMEHVYIPGSVEKKTPVFLAINDSGLAEWQYDNFGFLMVTIEHR